MFAKNGWYCAGFAREIGEKPLARRILDIPMVIMRGSDNKFHALLDRCTHRFAPLSKGVRIEDTIECPYHGLRFNLTGDCVLNPHGDGRIPAGSKVRSFPIVQVSHFIWVWPGNPDLADVRDIPDMQLFDIGNREPVCGHVEMAVNYQLVLDNLLDLSHAAYLHAGTLSPVNSDPGSNLKPKRETETDINDRSILVRAKSASVPTPTSQALYFDEPVGDFHSWMEWIFPGTMRHSLSMTELGGEIEAGARAKLVHLITPETETSTHYFWMHTRNARADDAEVDAKTRDMILYAFTQEDEPMIEACQANMEGKDFVSLAPIYLHTDKAGTHCRRIIDQRVKSEQAESGERVR